jgi:L-amino acid N-acyltransferase YncA
VPQENDAAELLNLTKRYSASTRYSISFKSLHTGTRTEVERPARADDPLRRTILAEIVVEAEGGQTLAKPLVGVAHYWRVGKDVANLTIAVGDRWRGLGVGRALITELSKLAQNDGVRRFYAFFGRDNAPTLGLLNQCGLEVRLLPGNEGAWEIFLDRSPQRYEEAQQSMGSMDSHPRHRVVCRDPRRLFDHEPRNGRAPDDSWRRIRRHGRLRPLSRTEVKDFSARRQSLHQVPRPNARTCSGAALNLHRRSKSYVVPDARHLWERGMSHRDARLQHQSASALLNGEQYE